VVHGYNMENILIFIDFVKMLYKARSMIWTMAIRDLKARYVGSLFGFLWAIIDPLVRIAIYGTIFGVFLKNRPNPVYGTDSFLLYLLCGLIPWLFFMQTVNASTNVIVSNRNLIKKAVGFPSEILPIVTVISNIINHLIGMGILLLILVAFTARVPFYAPLFVVYLFLIAFFAVGLGWIVSSLNVYLRDVQQVVGLIMLGWFFFTPIFYSSSIVPPQILTVLKFNPMYHIVDGYRLTLLTGRLPSGWDFFYLVTISFLTFGLGGLFFRKLKPGFAEVL